MAEYLEPPNSLEAEQGVLGALLRNASCYGNVTGIINHFDFYHPRHQEIYRAIQNLVEAGKPVDIITVFHESEICNHKYVSDNGRTYLVDLMESVASVANVESYAQVVLDKSILRRAIAVANELVRSCYSMEIPTEEIIGSAAQDFGMMLASSSDHKPVKVSAVLQELMIEIDDFQTKRKVGITTGFHSFDELTGGLHSGDFVVLGGRPKFGKTSKSLNMVIGQAKHGLSIGYFSAETDRHHLIARLQCTVAEVNYMKWKMGRLSAEDLGLLTTAMAIISEWKLHIIDIPQIEIQLLVSQAALLKSQHNIDVLYVDYGQLLTTRREFRDLRAQMDYIIRQLKRLAQKLQIPIVVLVQINREPSKGRPRPPSPVDFKESGAWEEHSDIQVILWKPPRPKKDMMFADDNMIEALVWQRNGPSGKFKLAFEPEITKFTDPDEPSEQEEVPF